MSNKTLHDLIMWTEEFHLGMSRSLQMGSVHAGERERLLLEYLIGHEQELAQLVNRYGENARATALNTWVSAYTEQYPPENIRFPFWISRVKILRQSWLTYNSSMIALSISIAI